MDAVTIHAERTLSGDTLADKLDPWPEVDVRIPWTSPLPDLGRPAALALPRVRRNLAAVKPQHVRTERGRARILHELANHELQAIELLSLALLKWPEAPAGFRRGLVATLRDEQRHCQAYIERLEACGGSLGDVPVSRYFWDTLSVVDSVDAFVAGLSLCFEMANLDFCQAWSARFAEAGDGETARVIDGVYADEIRHVAHGLVWFDRWAEGQRLEHWQRVLPPPLTPSRARGPQFDTVGRAKAGLSDDEIATLRLVGGSRGRPPRVLQFDAGIEDAIAGRDNPRTERVTAALSTLPMFLCGSEDIVVAPTPPTSFLEDLARAGFDVPRFVEAPTEDEIGPHPIAAFEPWGPSPRLPDVAVASHGETPNWDRSWAALSSKVETLRRARRVAWSGPVAPLGEVWTEPGTPVGRWVIKAPLSTSGTDRIRGEGPLSTAHRAWLDRTLARDGAVVYQPWFDVVFDVSVHVTVSDDVRIDGMTRFSTRSGVFAGTWLGPVTKGLPTNIVRFVHGDGDRSRAVQPVLERAAVEAGRWAQDLGFQGHLSIDAAVVRTERGLRVHPWLETNARRTLGRVAMALRSRVHPRSSGWWRVSREPLAQERAVVMRDGRIASGTLRTSTGPDLYTWMDVHD